MKKVIFSFLVILMFGIVISNNSYSNVHGINNNSFVSVPYFNNKDINSDINSYVNKFTSSYDYLFVDYDIVDSDNFIMYMYKENGDSYDLVEQSFFIDDNSLIINNDSTLDVDGGFNFIDNRIVDDDKMIALTFDDGPNHNTNKVLDILDKYKIKATFFVLGRNINGNEDIVKRIHSSGHEIGNHMFSHQISTRLSDTRIKEEVNMTDKLVYDITDKYPSLVRTSYGIYNNRIKRIIDRPIILWNIDTLDWKYHDSKRIANKVFNNIKRGNIVLMHDIYSATANSLEIIIPKLLSDGYVFVKVSDLLYYDY